jgi:hypothetical protein
MKRALSLVCVVFLAAAVLPGSRAVARDNLTLARKAALFEKDMQDRFIFDGQVPPKRRAPTSDMPFVSYNMPDNAYMTGIYLGTASFWYAATKDADARQAAREAFGALDLLLKVTGKSGLMARSCMPVDMKWNDDGMWRLSSDGKYRWRGDVSSDQIDGVMYGYSLFYDLAANDEEKAVVAANVDAIMSHIIDNGMQIVGFDGQPTTWGKYYPKYVRSRERMNGLLALQHLKVAAHVTGKKKFSDQYRRLVDEEGYAKLAVNARRMADPLKGAVNHSDDVLLCLAYYPLLRLETDPDLKSLYLDSLRRTWNGDRGYPGVKVEANPYCTFMYHAFTGDGSGDAAAIRTLERFPLDMKFNRATLEKYQKEFGFTFDPAPESAPTQPGAVVPVDLRPKSWSAWVADPYKSGTRGADAGMEYTGLDFTMAYWLGRYHGYISPEQ